AVEDVAAGYKESVVIPKKPSLRAQGGRHPADEDEQRVGRKLVLLAACGVAQDNAFELAVAAHPSHARARTDLDPRMVLAAFDRVPGRGFARRPRASAPREGPRARGGGEAVWPGQIRPADDERVPAGVEEPAARRRAVIHARADQVVNALGVELAILRPHRPD